MKTLALILVSLWWPCSGLRAESFAAIDQLGKMCSHIYLVEAARVPWPAASGETRERVECTVLETWKGGYDPAFFANRPPRGKILPPGLGGHSPGRLVLFFAAHNHRPGQLGHPDMVLPVNDGIISYPVESAELGPWQKFTLAGFKRRLFSPDPVENSRRELRLLPTIEILAHGAVLVIYCRAELRDGRLLGKVREIWKGSYNPREFDRRPPAGFVEVNLPLPKPGDSSGFAVGDEFIVFWNRHNQVTGGLRQFNLMPVRDGNGSLVVDRFGTREQLSIAEIKALVTEPLATDPSQPRRNR